MNKFLIVIVVIFSLSSPIFALDDKSPKKVLELYNIGELGEYIVHTYFNGMGQALLATAWGKQFCTDENFGFTAHDWWNIYLKEYYSREEFYEDAYIKIGGFSHATLLLYALEKTFPCEEKNQE